MFNLIKTIASPLAINKNRIAWIDIAKGIAILLVIIGHCPQIGSPLISIIFFISYAVILYSIRLYI